MQGSRALSFAVVAILVLAAFMVGRLSVRPTETSEPPKLSQTQRPQKLSAITRNVPDRSGRSNRQGASTGTRQTSPSLAGQIDADQKTVAEFLSATASATGNLRAMSEIVAAWMDHDPDEAIEWLASGDRRDDILRQMFEIWGRENPSSALAWIESKRETDRYEHAATGLAGNLEPEQALELAETLAEPSHRAEVWFEAGLGLYVNDSESALDRLAAAGFPDELESLMVKSWKQGLSNKSKRNAQNLASVYSAARAAGAEFGGGSAAEIAQELITGIQGNGEFSTTRFQVPNLSDGEIDFALQYLRFEDNSGQLSYASSSEDEPLTRSPTMVPLIGLARLALFALLALAGVAVLAPPAAAEPKPKPGQSQSSSSRRSSMKYRPVAPIKKSSCRSSPP